MSTPWIVTPRPSRSPELRLVCIPHAGGGASTFRDWSRGLPTADVGVVQLPGRAGRLGEPLVESVSAAADGAADAIARLATYPTVLFGHGLGALIAFEAARRLRDRQWPLLALFVSGRRAPALRDPEPPIAHLPVSVFLAEVRRRFGGLPDAALSDDESAPLLVRSLRADFAMAEGYRYEQAAPFDCPIVACGGTADPHASPSDLVAWRTETRSRVSVHTFAGGHLYLERERAAVTARFANHLSVMLGALARCTGVR